MTICLRVCVVHLHSKQIEVVEHHVDEIIVVVVGPHVPNHEILHAEGAHFTYNRRANRYRYNRGAGIFSKIAKSDVGVGKRLAKKGIKKGLSVGKHIAKKHVGKVQAIAKKKISRITKGAAAAAKRKIRAAVSMTPKKTAAIVAKDPALKKITKQKIKSAVGVATNHLLAGKPLNGQFMQKLFDHGTLS